VAVLFVIWGPPCVQSIRLISPLIVASSRVVAGLDSNVTMDSIQVAKQPTTIMNRLPTALTEGLVASATALGGNCAFMVPMGLVGSAMNKPESASQVFRSGLKWGLQMSGYSACYQGGEAFMRTLRDVDDGYNRIFGSGFSSAMYRIHEGPSSMARGFLTGAGFMSVLESIRGYTGSKAPSVSRQSPLRSSIFGRMLSRSR
jgi:hypothetical protein